MLDYLIVGAGLFGAVCARELTNAGKRVLVIEKNDHLGGMCHTPVVDGIVTQAHGGHIYHTNDRRLWDYVNKYAEWRQYSHHVKATVRGEVYSFPINLMTLQQVFGATGAVEAERLLSKLRQPPDDTNLKAWAVSQVGQRLYEMFIEGYTAKQWGKDPAELPASIIKRLPVRMNWSDEYFSDEYQGLPVGGYTQLFENLLHKIPVELGQDYLSKRIYWDLKARRTIYTGPLDVLYGKMVGGLDYRSLKFVNERVEVEDYQGCPTMNYPDREVPFTRIHEHKHWYPTATSHTVITREYPAAYDGTNEPYYPINDEANMKLYGMYLAKAKSDGRLVVGGRMGMYRYMDMHQVIAAALQTVKGELN